MIKGKIVYLTSVEEFDLPTILKWRNTRELNIYFREHKLLRFADQLEWFTNILSKKNQNDFFFGIRLVENDELIGITGVNYINWICRNCQLSLYIGKDNLYVDNNGWAEESLKLMETYAFGTLNLHKIFSEIFEFDINKIELLKNNNYKLEAELYDHVYKNGRYHKSYILAKIKVDDES